MFRTTQNKMKEAPKNTHGGKRAGAGRKAKEKTVSTGFRVHADSLETIRSVKYPINFAVNKLVKKIANEIKEWGG